MIWYSLIAATAAVSLEYMYRVLPGGWFANMWIFIWPSLLVSFCIHKMVTNPGTPLIGAFILWSLAVMGMRVFVTTVVLRDYVSPGTWVALGLLVCARVAQSVWR